MKLRIASDFHSERIPSVEYDLFDDYLMRTDDDKNQILLLAGDIVNVANDQFRKIETYFDELSQRFKHVYLVLGNHEHYDYDFLNTATRFSDFLEKYDNITLLNTNSVELDENTILYGATLWTDMNKNNPINKNFIQQSMSDFRVIRYGEEKFTPTQAYFQHLYSMTMLSNIINKKYYNSITSDEKAKKIIVMTHHAPSYKSVSSRFAGHAVNAGFVSDLDDYIASRTDAIKLWIHGHVHNSNDYMIENTRIISNPHGYGYGIDRENKSYNDNLVIDTDDLI